MPLAFNAPAFFGAWLIVCCVPAAGAQDNILFREDFHQPLGERWRQIKFHDLTDYHVITENSNTCLMASARGGCSAFATKVDLASCSNMVCSWNWKIDHCPRGGCDDRISGFDHAARVFIAFDTWFGVPRTINYVWANQAQINAIFEHPFSSRTKFIVVESGNTNAGRWLFERRNVQEDWSRLFKGEPMPKITAVGVFTDSHYTGSEVTGWYRNITFQQNDTAKSVVKTRSVPALEVRTVPSVALTSP
jgi:hypothetical protein